MLNGLPLSVISPHRSDDLSITENKLEMCKSKSEYRHENGRLEDQALGVSAIDLKLIKIVCSIK